MKKRYGITLQSQWVMFSPEQAGEGDLFLVTTHPNAQLDSTFDTEADAVAVAEKYELDGFSIQPVWFR